MRTSSTIRILLGLLLAVPLAGVSRAHAQTPPPAVTPPPDSTAAATPMPDTAAVATPAVSPSARPEGEPGRILLGARIGGLFPEAFNRLDANFLAELEVAWQLPIPRIDRRLGLFLDAGYTQPTTSATRIDPRITANCAGGSCSETYTVTARDLGFTLGLHYVQPLSKGFLVYGGVGGRMHLVRTISEAVAGTTSLGVNTEDSTKFGVMVRLGGAYRIGPGAIVLEAHMEWTGIDHLVTGGERAGESANIANLALQAGYLFFIL